MLLSIDNRVLIFGTFNYELTFSACGSPVPVTLQDERQTPFG